MEDHLRQTLQRAVTLFSLKRYKECIAEARKALAIDVQHTASMELILICMINLNKPVKDIQKIAKILLNIDANNSTAHFAMGHYYGERSQDDKAISSFKTAIQFDPNNADYFLRLAHAYEMKDEYLKVEQSIARALAINPEHPGALTYKSQVELRSLKLRDAEISAKMALALNPLNPQAHAQKGALALANMEAEQAATHFIAAIQQDPSDINYRRHYLDSLLSKWIPFRYLFSKYWIFNHFPDLVRTLFIFMFAVMILLFKTETAESSLTETIGYWLSWIGFSLNFLQWFFAPAWRYFKSKKIWKTAPLPLRSIEFYALISIQLSLVALFYYFITDDFRGFTTSLFLSGYALISHVPISREGEKSKKILSGLLILCYLVGFLNLVLDIFMAPDPVPKSVTIIPMLGWMVLTLLPGFLDWVQVKREGN